MTLSRFLLRLKYSMERPSHISVERWNAMLRFVEKNKVELEKEKK